MYLGGYKICHIVIKCGLDAPNVWRRKILKKQNLIHLAVNPIFMGFATSLLLPSISRGDDGMSVTAIGQAQGTDATGLGNGGDATAYSDPAATVPTGADAGAGSGAGGGSGGSATAIGTSDLRAAANGGGSNGNVGDGGAGGDASVQSVSE